MSVSVTTFVSGLSSPQGLAFDSNGNLYCSNLGNNTISKITSNGTVLSFASGLSEPRGLAFDSSGNLYCANFGNGTISKIMPDGTVTTFVSGLGILLYLGLAFDSNGNLYYTNPGNGTIGKITPDGTVTTFVSGLTAPQGLAFDSNGNLYCTDFLYDLFEGIIVKITSTGNISTFASGLIEPYDLSFDSSDNLYCSDNGNGTISKITSDGTVTTFVSDLSDPKGLAFDSSDNLYCANSGNNTISKIAIIITTIINVQNSYTVTYGITPFKLNATSNSPATIMYSSSNPSIVSVNETGLITINGSSNMPVILTLSQVAAANYTSATTTVEFNVFSDGLSENVLTNFSIPSKTFGDSSFDIVAPTSNSTGTFTYTSSNTSVATISGNTITIVGAGETTITATQAETDTYRSGISTTTFTVNKATPTITMNTFIEKLYSDDPFFINYSSNNQGEILFSIDSLSNQNVISVNSNGLVTILGLGEAKINVTQMESLNYTSSMHKIYVIIVNTFTGFKQSYINNESLILEDTSTLPSPFKFNLSLYIIDTYRAQTSFDGANGIFPLASHNPQPGNGLYYTKDYGKSWFKSNIVYNVPTVGTLKSVSLKGNYGLACSTVNSYYSSNAGETWNINNTPLINGILGSEYGIGSGINTGLYYTVNFGESWIQSNITTGVFNYLYLNSLNGFA